jgi:prepilin-type N-terminal cleavage/methylation domain-containing protein
MASKPVLASASLGLGPTEQVLKPSPVIRCRAFTLVELMLVLGILALLAYFTGISMRGPLQRSALPESGHRLRSLIQLTWANAMLDGKRYRIRMLSEDEELAEDLTPRERLQPMVEIERDPAREPGVFTPVLASWAQSDVFVGDVWCFDVRPGEPNTASMLVEPEEMELADEEERREELGLEDDQSWVMILEPDGTSEWMVFRLVDCPHDDFHESGLEEYPQLAVIVDGPLGLVFLQRPLHEEEIDMLASYGHSPLLRRDFMTSKKLTDEDVEEIKMEHR